MAPELEPLRNLSARLERRRQCTRMADAAFAEARPYCIRHHTVVQDGCWFNRLYTRAVPSHAIELAAVFLDLNVAAILHAG